MDGWIFKDYLIVGLLIVNFYYIYSTLKMSKNNIKLRQILFDTIYIKVDKLDLRMDKIELKEDILINYCQKSLDSEDKIKKLKEYNVEMNKVNEKIKIHEENIRINYEKFYKNRY